MTHARVRRGVPLKLENHLIANRARLLAFIKSKVDDDDLAEDILQDSLLRALRSGADLEDSQKLVSWLYRIIRNAITDAYRRRGASQRKLEGYAHAALATEPTPEDEAALCGCFVDLLPTMKPEYAELLESMELGDATTEEMTSRLGITANNLKVRRHRARRALQERLEQTCLLCAEHGCLDCSCSH